LGRKAGKGTRKKISRKRKGLITKEKGKISRKRMRSKTEGMTKTHHQLQRPMKDRLGALEEKKQDKMGGGGSPVPKDELPLGNGMGEKKPRRGPGGGGGGKSREISGGTKKRFVICPLGARSGP